MPRSRSRTRGSKRDRRRPVRVSDATVLVELLGHLDRPAVESDLDLDPEADYDAELLLLDAFERAAWSFHAGPGPRYVGPSPLEQALARLRSDEWFLFEFELPSGLTAAEEWMAQREGEPGSAGKRRAVLRFLNSECGVFDVREARSDGGMLLVPLTGGEPVRARRIDRSEAMVSGIDRALPVFEAGNTIAGRLYWRDDDSAELSAGACLVTPQARAAILGDPPPPSELQSGLALEALLGADASSMLAHAADACFPNHADALLLALSDGTFGYRRLWRELEGERDAVHVARQLLWELDAWTDTEPELLAWAVAGAWLRRREAAAGRGLTGDVLARERRALEDHVRTVLDTQAEPSWPAAAAGTVLEISGDETLAAIDELEVNEVEWIVDVRPSLAPLRPVGALPPGRIPDACVIAEQPLDPFDAFAGDASSGPRDTDQDDEDEEAVEPDEEENSYAGDDQREDENDDLLADEDEDPFGDEDEEGQDADEPGDGEEDGPLILRDEIIKEGDDEAVAVLETITETLLAEGRTHRPQRLVFRQRALAARLGETFRDAGLDVALRCFDEAVDVADLDAPPEEEPDEEPFDQPAGDDRPATEAERLAFTRLKQAVTRARDGLEMISWVANDDVALTLTLARPLPFDFTTLEGVEAQVGSVAVVAEVWPGHSEVRLYLAAPGAGSRFACRGPDGELLIQSGDAIVIETAELQDQSGQARADSPAERADPGGVEKVDVIPFRTRYATPPRPLMGRDLEVAAGVMEAVAAAAERVAEDGAQGPGAVDVRVDPLGDVKVEWRGSTVRE